MTEFRWLTNDEIVSLVNPACVAHGFAELNCNETQPTCRVIGALWDGVLVEAFAFHMYPILGPLVKVNLGFKSNGETSRGLADRMAEFMEEVKARGCLAIADSPVTERLCERFGMKKITSPVYEFVRRKEA